MQKLTILVGALLATIMMHAQLCPLNEKYKALPIPDNNSTEFKYGSSIAIDGNYAVVGADGYNLSQGSAFVLYFDGNEWNTVASLSASDGEQGDGFGRSVAISGDNIAIGAINNGASSGAVYVYTKPLSGWKDMTETAKLTGSDCYGGDYLGCSVSIDGNNIIAGAFVNYTVDYSCGAAYLYTKPTEGWKDMTEIAKLTASDGATGDYFGYSVSISEDNIIIGSYNNDNNGVKSGSAYVYTKPVDGWKNMTETAKLTPSDGFDEDRFGYSVSISGDNIVIGSYWDDDNGINSGSAYVYSKPASGWVNMTETAKLTASDGDFMHYFGEAVCISGNHLVIGATTSGVGGSAYVFTKPLSGWTNMTETAIVSASDASDLDLFGYSVGISGSNVIVGSYWDDDNGNNCGSAYIFTKLISGWSNMNESYKILPIPIKNNLNNYYGVSVATDGNYAVVGADGYNYNQGKAYVLYNNAGTWVTLATLMASDGASYNNFGCSVDISGDNIIVGSYGDDDNGSTSGSAYVFSKPISGWIDMTETAKLKASDGASYDNFGNSVSISGNNIVVGAYWDDDNGTSSGSAYVYTKPESGWENMTETAKLIASDGAEDDNFGCSVSISNDNIVVGSFNDDDNGENSGSVYIFTKPIGDWQNMTETAKLIASDGAEGDNFGFSVSIYDDNVVVGSYYDENENGTSSGSAYVYTKPESGWKNMSETAKLLASDGIAGNRFGNSVDIYGDKIVIGVELGDGIVSESGSAYVYTKLESGWENISEMTKLISLDGAEDDNFGCSVSISGDNIIIGSKNDDDNAGSSGSVYLFQIADTSNPTISCIEDQERITNLGSVYIASDTEFDIKMACDNDAIIKTTVQLSGATSQNETQTESLSGITLAIGITNVTWTIYNAQDKVASCSFLINVSQNKEPITSCFGKEIKKCLSPKEVINDNFKFGTSVSVNGNNAVIGEPGYDDNTGRAFVYEFNGANWIEKAELTASDKYSGDNFGCSVSISGDNIVIGSSSDDDNGSSSGSAYVFTKPESGWKTMVETAKFTASDGASYDYFGCSVSISGNEAIVGAYEKGSAYIFEKPLGGWENMTETAKLTASDGELFDQFGYSVSISNNSAVIGAYGDDNNGTNWSGSAYIFEKPPLGWTDTVESAKITASDASSSDGFGYSVSISGNNIVVGAYNNDRSMGAAYVFEKPDSGWKTATETIKLTPSDKFPGDYFGWSVKIKGDYIIAGATQDDDHGSASGSIYVFEKDVAGWINKTEKIKLSSKNSKPYEYFGNSVDLSDNKVIIGAPYCDENGTSSGAAYFFELGCDDRNPVVNCTDDQLINSISEYTIEDSEFDLISASDNDFVTDTTYQLIGATIQSEIRAQSLKGIKLNQGATTITWTVYDYVGNSSSCSFKITVDNISNNFSRQIEGINIYPNPSTGKLTIESSNQEIVAVNVIDVGGKTITASAYLSDDNHLDLSGFANGIYLLQIKTKQGFYTTMVIKQ